MKRGEAVEQDMSELVDAFESGKKRADESAVTQIVESGKQEDERFEEALDRFAREDHKIVYQLVEGDYPNILDRELLAGALEKKYLDPESEEAKEYEELLEARERNKDLGVSTDGQTERTIKRHQQIGNFIDFLTKMNDRAYEKLEQGWQKEAEGEQAEAAKKFAIESAERKQENTEVEVPSRLDPEKTVRLKLGDYIHALAILLTRKPGKDEIKSINMRIDALKDTMLATMEKSELIALYEKSRNDAKRLEKEYLELEADSRLYEPTAESQEALLKAADLSRTANFKTIIYSEFLKS